MQSYHRKRGLEMFKKEDKMHAYKMMTEPKVDAFIPQKSWTKL